jgi:hypothetical protein
VIVVTKTSNLLLEHFLNWQRKLGERKTSKEFAAYIGISDKVFNHIFTGKREPTEEQTQLFEAVFQDIRFCEVTGRKPGDRELILLKRKWPQIDYLTRNHIAEDAGIYKSDRPSIKKNDGT